MTDLVERLTDEEITRIGETLGAKIVGHSDYESWGHGYRYDVFGRATIPNVPRNLIPFARAIEAEIIKRLRSQLEAANLANTKQAALEQDAARYRWLRDAIYIDPKMLILRIDKVFLRGPLPEALDSAIDDAIDVAVDKAMKA